MGMMIFYIYVEMDAPGTMEHSRQPGHRGEAVVQVRRGAGRWGWWEVKEGLPFLFGRRYWSMMLAEG